MKATLLTGLLGDGTAARMLDEIMFFGALLAMFRFLSPIKGRDSNGRDPHSL